ncbi:MAG: EAL domain-containing protein [Dehalococcoidia bacterium]|nr:EAL domain-containing protein [Dehalococcoidia bacterium]
MTRTAPEGGATPGPTPDVIPPGTADPWAGVVERAVRGDGFSLAFQPIVDLEHAAVVGYEALSRFEGVAGLPPSTPPQWFARARALGVLPELEARVLSKALDARDRLPPNTFLAVNLSSEAFASDLVRRVLRSPRGLHRMVVEVAQPALLADAAAREADGDIGDIGGIGDIEEAMEGIRAAGAYLAVDDVSASYDSLSSILRLRPDFVKLDRSLIADLAQDEAKLALVEMFGQFASRADAWLLAEGVETVDELSALSRLGVPLAQGYLLGRPAPDWTPLPVELRELLVRAQNVAAARLTVSRFVEPWPYLEHGREAEGAWLVGAATAEGSTPAMTVLPVLDEFRRPVGIYALSTAGPVRPVTVLKRTTPVADAARRAITRPLTRRFDPLVCIDDLGDYVGVVRLERLIEALTGALEDPGSREVA